MEVKRLMIRPSAGKGATAPIATTLTAYCNALQTATPTHLPWSGIAVLDRSQLANALAVKVAEVGATAGISLDWASASLHEVDAGDSTIWNDVDAVAWKHDVTVTPAGGAPVTQYFSISFLT